MLEQFRTGEVLHDEVEFALVLEDFEELHLERATELPHHLDFFDDRALLISEQHFKSEVKFK